AGERPGRRPSGDRIPDMVAGTPWSLASLAGRLPRIQAQGNGSMGLFDGKVALVTGAGRGIGRSESLLLAGEGAKVVVNDLGGSGAGEGADQTPAQQVVDEIAAAGGEAVANYDDCSSWTGAETLVQQAIDNFGGLDVLICN